jgi:hypothetical protein
MIIVILEKEAATRGFSALRSYQRSSLWLRAFYECFRLPILASDVSLRKETNSAGERRGVLNSLGNFRLQYQWTPSYATRPWYWGPNAWAQSATGSPALVLWSGIRYLAAYVHRQGGHCAGEDR